MRSLDEIRTEMADSAYYAKISKEAGVQSAVDRHEAAYGALAWVLEEPWKVTGEFEPKIPLDILIAYRDRLKAAMGVDVQVLTARDLLRELEREMTDYIGQQRV